MTIDIRPGTPSDFDHVMQLMATVFHEVSPDREQIEVERGVFEPDRSLVAYDGAELAGHVGAFSRELSVPGAVLPAAFVTMVGVAPTHRRQGLATTMLRRQLHDIRELGESVAVLWASESPIYPHHGYGLATHRLSLNIDTRAVRLPWLSGGTGRLSVGSPQDLRQELIKVYDTERANRPGFAGRTDAWWDHRLVDPAGRRGGAGPLKALLHEGDEGVDGYALFRVRGSWEDGTPNGEVVVAQLIASTPAAYQAMWGFLLRIDLTRSASMWFGAADEPLLHLVDEPRRVGARVMDGLWLRLVNVPAALAARRYAAPVDVVIEVTDNLIPDNDGRFLLRGSMDLASCEHTTEPAGLRLDVATLGALYLGGNSLGSLAAAGRVSELRPGALAAADAAFRWHRAPAGIDMF
jgi:predicted acetyltransferase